MEHEDFVLFQSFNSKEEAGYLIDLLTQEKISHEFILPDPNAASVIVRSEFDNLCLVNLHPSDFEKVNLLLKKIDSDSLSDLSPDHYLFQFSNDELMHILLHQEEWSSQDYLLARKILIERGVNVDDKKLDKEIESRLKIEHTPKRGKMIWMVIGLASAFLGGFFGILLGWGYYADKTTDRKGKIFYVYDQQTRSYGLAMMTIGTIVLVASVIWTIIIGASK